MSVLTKICGLSTPETLDAAVAGGASHVGFVFFAKSPRNLTPDAAAALAARVPPHVKSVGLFVDPTGDELARILSQVRLDILQLHGHETPETVARVAKTHAREVWKAIPVRSAADRDTAARYKGAADLILYDAKPPEGADLPGGNGLRFDWTLLSGHRHPLPWALSGGLDPRNVAEAIRVTGAPLVDVSSGVESAPGVKDVDKIAAFLKEASKT
ncbi:phosphoribosylanthranilate isomerase [Sphingomonas sp. SUN039]|uniref:phosphoribosylanthranilate isomerase n=1 Tax=Sphingomonas sp. SUN039 TaxID=2937787 RepID=UPI0021646D1E|nr:phosphoribosylanthranilate isomerase [Sphingomonas sp. SUN039]UVO52925.1 phosphoribosylanthranilate isomerase [Sphingomonas sp. SUN039]